MSESQPSVGALRCHHCDSSLAAYVEVRAQGDVLHQRPWGPVLLCPACWVELRPLLADELRSGAMKEHIHSAVADYLPRWARGERTDTTPCAGVTPVPDVFRF